MKQAMVILERADVAGMTAAARIGSFGHSGGARRLLISLSEREVRKRQASGYLNYSSGSLSNRGSNGNYWESVCNSATNGHNLNFNSTNVNPQNNNNRANGLSVAPSREYVDRPALAHLPFMTIMARQA